MYYMQIRSAEVMVKVRETYRGTRGGLYITMSVEGSILRHISRYALGKMEERSGVYWDVLVEKVSGKPIIRFDLKRPPLSIPQVVEHGD